MRCALLLRGGVSRSRRLRARLLHVLRVRARLLWAGVLCRSRFLRRPLCSFVPSSAVVHCRLPSSASSLCIRVELTRLRDPLGQPMNQLRIFCTAITTARRRTITFGRSAPYSGFIDDQLVAIAWISESRLTAVNCRGTTRRR